MNVNESLNRNDVAGLVGFGMLVIAACTVSFLAGIKHAQTNSRREAVLAGVAYWRADPDSGEPKFYWKTAEQTK